jgi:hypothetical protein
MDKGQQEGNVMNMPKAPAAFVQALHKQPVTCESPDCVRSVEVTDISQRADRVKSFQLRCHSCQWEDTISGCLQVDPPWDEGSLMEITEEHMLHLDGFSLLTQSSPSSSVPDYLLLLWPTGRIGLATGRGKTVRSGLVVNITVWRCLRSLPAEHSSSCPRILRFAAA